MLVQKTPEVIGKQMWAESKVEQGLLLHRFHSDIVHSYLSKPEQRISFSNLQDRIHFLPFKSNFSHKNMADHCQSKLNPIFVTASKTSKTSAPKSTQLPQKLSKSIEDIQNLKPVVEKAKTTKRRKVKSGKKRQSKTGVKRKKVNSKKSNYSIDKYESTVSTTNSSSKATEQLTCPQLIRKITNDVSPYHQLKKQCQQLPCSVSSARHDGANRIGSVEKDRSLPPCVSKANSPSIALTKQEGILLPHPSFSSVSPASKRNTVKVGDAPHKSLPSTLSRNEGVYGNPSLEGRNCRRILQENSLKDRLNLIHCYGTDYMAVTRNFERKMKKAAVLKEYQNKTAEREEAEKIKQLQRKKIYALNRLMTNLEREKFNEFMKAIGSTEQ